MNKVRRVRFQVTGTTVEKIETRARAQAEDIAGGRPYDLSIGDVTPEYWSTDQAGAREVMTWEAETEVTFDYGDKTETKYPSAALKPAADVRQFGAGGQVTP